MDDPRDKGLSEPRRVARIIGGRGGKSMLANAMLQQASLARADIAEMEKKLLGMGAEVVGDEYVLTQFRSEAHNLLNQFEQRFEMLHAAGVAVGTSWAELDLGDKPVGNRRARRRAMAKAKR